MRQPPNLERVRTARFEAAVVIALFALMLRLMIPAGWMPDASSGSMKLVLCSGATTQIVTIDGQGSGTPDQSHHGDQGLCAFSLTGPAMAGSAGTAVALPVMFVVAALQEQSRTPAAATQPAVRIPPPQGP